MKREPPEDRIRRDAAAMGVPLSPSGAERLVDLETLLRDRAVPLGLISASDSGRLYERHVLDSLRAASLFTREDETAFDLGSGAGLPGLVAAIAVPWCRFALSEPRRIRAGFLELALDSLDVPNAEVTLTRAEDLRGPVDVVTARAFAPLGRTWRIASRLLRRGGRLVYFAGASLVDPAGEARQAARLGEAARVSTSRVLATSPPLVIMARK